MGKINIDILNQISKTWIEDHKKLYSEQDTFKISTDIILENMLIEPEKIDYEDIVNKEVFDELKVNGWTKEKPLCIGIGDKGEIFVHTGNHRLAMINANIDIIKKYRLLHFRFPINNLKKIYCKLKYIKFPDNHKSYRVLTDGTNFYPNGLIPKWNR